MAVSHPDSQPDLEGEDWHNVSDPTARRKLRNRQNQRARRLRNINRGAEPLIKQYVPGRKAGHFVYLLQLGSERKQKDDLCPESNQIQSVFPALPSNHWNTDELVRKLTGGDEKQIRSAIDAIGPSLLTFAGMGGVNLSRHQANDYWQRGPYLHSDRLLTLLYYNVFRAFSWNVEILGFDISQMSKENYPSPFLSAYGSDTSAMMKLPRSLRPTEIQRKVPHHAGYDIIPCPVIRNNMIQHTMTDAEEDELCLDMEGFNQSSSGIGTEANRYSDLEEGNRSGITIWGDPWDVKSWEMSEYIALKYPWLVAGAIETQIYTNARRRARGWKELHFA